MNEQEQLQQSVPDRLPGQEETETKETTVAEGGAMVLVKGFSFKGIDGVATEDELQNLLKDAVGRELSFEGLKGLADRVTGFLRTGKDYFLARAYLPEQDVTSGIITIEVTAGRAEGPVEIETAKGARIRKNLLSGIAGGAIRTGEAMKLKEVEKAVLLMNDLPGMTANASIEKGKTSGVSRVVIKAEEGPLMNSVLNADNYGDRYTGTMRGVYQLSVNDPTGIGDQVTVSGTVASKLRQARTGYSLPLWTTGVKWAGWYSFLSYELGKDLSVLEAKGSAGSMGSELNYAFLRRSNASLWGALGYTHQGMKDEALGMDTDDRKTSSWDAKLSGTFYDAFGGGAMSTFSMAYSRGRLDLSGLKAYKDADSQGPKAAGMYSKATYSAARLQRITEDFSLFCSMRGQFAGKNLDSSEKFILGGPSGVRAFPVGEGSGDEGHVMTLEMRYDLYSRLSPVSAQLVEFVDAGKVRLHNDAWAGAITNATGKNSYWLSGGGVGIIIGRPGAFSLRASFARRLGDNDGRNQDGTNADNRADKGSYWLQGLVWF